MTSVLLWAVPMVPYAALQLSALPGPPVFTGGAPRAPVGPLHPPRTSGAPARPDAGGPPSPLSARAVRESSRLWTWKALETPGWKILVADRVAVRGDVPVDVLRTSAAYLEAFHGMLSSTLGGEAQDVVFSARVFKDPAAFRRYAALRGAANAESFYDPRTAELVVCHEPSLGNGWLQKTLSHEFTHAYMDRVWNVTGPLWFCEGMAEYFSTFSVRDGRLVPGAIDRRSVLLLQLSGPLPLRRFLALGRDEMYGPNFPTHYAQAWALVHFLMSRGDGTVDLLLRGRNLEEVEKLERDWKSYLDGMSDQ